MGNIVSFCLFTSKKLLGHIFLGVFFEDTIVYLFKYIRSKIFCNGSVLRSLTTREPFEYSVFAATIFPPWIVTAFFVM